MMKRVIATASATILLSAIPSVAFGLSASSSQGSISGGATRWYHSGADVTATLNSFKANPVYGSALKVYDNGLDDTHGRFTTNVYDQGDRVRSGRVGFTTNNSNDMDGLKIRVCRDINNLPDSCSSWSGTQRNPIADD